MPMKGNPGYESAGLLATAVMIIFLIICLISTFIVPILAFIGIIVLICLLIVFVPKFSKNKKEKAEAEEINRKFKEFCTRVDTYTEELKKEKVDNKEKHIVNNAIYNSKFLPQIRERGENYFYENRVGDVTKVGNTYGAIVKGKQNYNTSIVINSGIIESASCDCRYFNDNNKYCKHIYALLCKIENKLENFTVGYNIQTHIENIKKEILSQEDELLDIIQKCSAFLEKKQTEYVIWELNKYNIFVNHYGDILDKMENKIKQTKSMKVLINAHSELVEIASILLNYEKLFIKKDFNAINNIKEYNQVIEDYRKKKAQNRAKNNSNEDDDFDEFLDDEVIINKPKNDVSLLSMLAASSKPKGKSTHKNNSKYSEKELDFFGLDDEEKDAVRSGNYAPWCFERNENIEPDDYYYFEGEENNEDQ